MYRYLKGHCKTLVCNDFHQIGRAELVKMLVILTNTRNICAHGNRLFNVRHGNAIMDCSAHKLQRHISNSGIVLTKSTVDFWGQHYSVCQLTIH